MEIEAVDTHRERERERERLEREARGIASGGVSFMVN
jgi:hypothetical protein